MVMFLASRANPLCHRKKRPAAEAVVASSTAVEANSLRVLNSQAELTACRSRQRNGVSANRLREAAVGQVASFYLTLISINEDVGTR
jgi:hypothetical protein